MTVASRVTEPVATRISGPIVTAAGMHSAQMYEVVQVGSLGLVGEVVRLIGDHATIQVYEDTTMVKPGAPVRCTGAPLSVWLGPGLVGNIYDGIQRPLPGIQAHSGAWIRRGEKVDPLDTKKLWTFEPLVKPGDVVTAGQAIGKVIETPLVDHLIMTPPGLSGLVRSIVNKGEYRLQDTLAVVETATGPREVMMVQQWPVREPRPIRQRLRIAEPLITGQRIIDTFFPQFGDQSALRDDEHAPTRHPNLRKVVGRQDDGALSSDFPNELANFGRLIGVEPAHRLVENQNRRLVNQRLCEAHPLAKALGQLADRLADHVSEARLVDDSSDAGLKVAAHQAAHFSREVEILQHQHLGVERRVFRQVADGLSNRDGVFEDVRPGDSCGAPGGCDEARQDLHRRGLPGTVGPEEADDLATIDFESGIAERSDRAVVLGQVTRLDHHIAHTLPRV